MAMLDTPQSPLGIQASYARLVVDHVRALDLDTGPVMAALGLQTLDADLSTQWVAPPQLTAALHVAAGLCRDPHIGLHIGQQMRPANLGQLGYALISCTRFEDGLALFERLQSLVCSALRTEHRIRGNVIESRFEALAELPRDTHFWSFTMVSRLAFARWVSGRRLVPTQLAMPCPAPADPQPLEDYVGCRIRFDAPEASEQGHADWLQLPNPHADQGMHQLMSAISAQQWAERGREPTGLLPLLRQHIARRLQAGELPLLDALGPDIEATLGLSARQLQRRLAEQGLAFKELVEDVRRTQVLHELRDTRLPLAEVAQRAAYAEPSSMHRAVRRWTGLTPLAVREEAAQQGQPRPGDDLSP
jgi:AraC-like DNA-binding protein